MKVEIFIKDQEPIVRYNDVKGFTIGRRKKKLRKINGKEQEAVIYKIDKRYRPGDDIVIYIER